MEIGCRAAIQIVLYCATKTICGGRKTWHGTDVLVLSTLHTFKSDSTTIWPGEIDAKQLVEHEHDRRSARLEAGLDRGRFRFVRWMQKEEQ
jgi:hypothetical protein